MTNSIMKGCLIVDVLTRDAIVIGQATLNVIKLADARLVVVLS